MFFPESDDIARRHPDLSCIAKQVDEKLSSISTPAVLRPHDFSLALSAEPNAVLGHFELLSREGILYSEEMVECEKCQNLMPAEELRQAVEDEDPLECSACGRVFPARSRPIVVYRLTRQALLRATSRPSPPASQENEQLESQPHDEPLNDRARHVLEAMLVLDAVDSDRRQSTGDIVKKALGNNADANAMKSVMAELNSCGLVGSKTGRGGGCWLTSAGLLRAEKLHTS